MITFAKETPPAARSWLQPTIAETPTDQNAVLLSLAQDGRMTDLWNEVLQWPTSAVQWLLMNASRFSQERICDTLAEPPADRIMLVWPQFHLALNADALADAIERHSPEATDLTTELWGELPAEFAQRVREFSKLAFQTAEALRSQFDHIPAVSKRGLGTPRQTAFRLAIADALASIDPALLTKVRQDKIVAILTNVVFGLQGDREVNAEAVRVDRLRRAKQRGENNSTRFSLRIFLDNST